MAQNDRELPQNQRLTENVHALLVRRAHLGAVIYAVLFFAILAVTPIATDHFREALLFGFMIVFSGIARLALSHKFKNLGTAQMQAWRFLFFTNIGMGSLSWGLFCATVLQSYGMKEISFIVLLPTAGIAGGSILSFTPIFPLVVSHLSLLLVPSILVLVAHGGEGRSLSFAVLISIFLAYLILQARQICRTVFEEMRKTEVIAAQKAEIEVERKKANVAADTRERFLSIMSHEIRTPLNGILGISDLLISDPANQKIADQLGLIRSSGENLLLILNEVLEFTEMARGGIQFDNAPFSISNCLTESIHLFEAAAQKKGLGLKLYIEPKVPDKLIGDAQRIKQLLVNLVGNAIKFTDKGEVNVLVGAVPKAPDVFELNVTVSDTGAGMEERDLHKIFDLFTSLDTSDRRKFGGVGVGLAVCKRICDGMNGRISVSSELGKGSSFRCTFQLTATLSDSDSRNAELSAVHQLNKNKKVLLAEDNPVNQMVAAAILKKAGYEVKSVANGLEALEALSKERFSLILMDCQMPGMDGFEATRKIRGMNQHQKTPIVALTAGALDGDRERCLESGMNDYLSKPINSTTLLACLERWIKMSESESRVA